MRRTDKEISSREEVDAIMHECDVCRLAFAVSGEPYLVPVAFGYDGNCLYLHTAKTGKKIDCMTANNRVCFEMERNVALVTDDLKPCQWSFSFESVVGFGTVQELVTPEDKARGLNHVMAHYSGRAWEIPEPALQSTRVWKITVSSVSGKRAQEKST